MNISLKGFNISKSCEQCCSIKRVGCLLSLAFSQQHSISTGISHDRLVFYLLSKMQSHFWLISCLIVFVVTFEGCFTENRMKTFADPIELHINFTFPENGLPPMKLHLGNVAEYLTEKPGQSSSLKRVVMVNITNPNKPYNPIPAGVFAAGLPVGSLIPGDIAKPCRTFIVGRCNNLCSSALDSCQPICDGRRDCLQSCRANAQICSRFCDSTFDQLNNLTNGEQDNPTPNFFLPKCLRNCRRDRACNSTCHRVCHTMLQKKVNTPYENPKADLPDFEAEMDDQLAAAEEGVSQNDQLE